MLFYVYQLRLADESLPFYVGKGIGNRAYSHLKARGNSHKSNKIRKAQRDGIKILVEFLNTNLDEQSAFRCESYHIAEYGRRDLGLGPLLNLTDGGEGISGAKLSRSQEYRCKMSTTKTGIKIDGPGNFFGKRHSKLTKDKISDSGRGRIHSEETKSKLCDMNSGPRNPRFGVEVSLEVRTKISESHSQKWLVIEPDGDEIIVSNLKSYCSLNNLTASAMYNVAKGICTHHKGYRCVKTND